MKNEDYVKRIVTVVLGALFLTASVSFAAEIDEIKQRIIDKMFAAGTTGGVKTVYAWARDAAGNVSDAKSATVTITSDNPVVTTTLLPRTGQTSCYGVAGTLIPCPGTGQDGDTLTGVTWPNPRFADNGDQTITDKLTGLVWTKAGVKTLYAWARDAAGNILPAMSATVTLDTTIPTVDAFSVPATSSTMAVPIAAFTTTDNIGVTGRMITEVSTKPLATATGWSTAPGSYTFTTPGIKTLYAWARDIAGNISIAKIAKVTVKLP